MLRYVSASSEDESLIYENRLIVRSIAPLCLIIAILNVAFYRVSGFGFITALIYSLSFIGMAAFLWAINRFLTDITIKTYIILLGLLVLMTIIVITYYPIVGMVVWIFSTAFLIVAPARNDLKMLVLAAVGYTLLSVYIYIVKYPGDISNAQRIALTVVVIALFWLSFYIKQINNRRYQFIKEQLLQTRVISEISAHMGGFSIINADEKITTFLKEIGLYYDIDRIGILLMSEDDKTLSYVHEWCAPELSPAVGFIRPISVCNDAWWTMQVEKKKIIIVSDIGSDNDITARAKAVMASLDMKSIMSLPIIVDGRVYGFLVNHTVRKHVVWREDQQSMMSLLANILSDAFSKLEAEKDKEIKAYFDSLTGLPNRHFFSEKLDDALKQRSSCHEQLAVLFIDLDSFKSINDTMGHAYGDMLLQRVSEKLKENLETDDFAARFGGDEFMVMMTGIAEDDALAERVNRIMDTFNHPITINEQEFFVTASGGIALFPTDGEDQDTLIKNADLAMYKAKEAGKNQYLFCTNEMKSEVERKVLLTNHLFKALKNNEFVLYYQPQVSISTRKITGIEALIRWKNPEFGLIPPGTFIPLAEQSGLIDSIGQWVLQEACRQNKEWQDMGLPRLRIAVNLSVEQFRNPDLVHKIVEAIDKAGLNPKYLELEITESVALKETQAVIPVLTKLKEHGIAISIDDFGTDYSSLARIKNLPIDRIKMAMEFVHGISVSDKDEAIAMIIITLANTLGLGVIAEGVENETQLRFLQKRLCDEVQGYYFYRPMPAEEMEALLHATMSNIPKDAAEDT